MTAKTDRFVAGMCMLLLCYLIPVSLLAQAADTTLSGIIADTSGKGVPSAKISVKNASTDQTVETLTDSSGLYNIPNLAPGDYQVSVSAEGFSTNESNVTIASGAASGTRQTMNLTLGGVLSRQNLGFSSAQSQGSAADQARLDKRSHMLKIHQRLGLIATAPLVASVITGGLAGGRSTSSTDRWVHMGLGSAAGDLYFMSAYYAIRAPRIQGTQTRGPIRLHKALAWIHGPGMILTPILGAIAFDQKSRGEKVHGIASAHGAVAIVTVAAYTASILAVLFKF